MMEILMTISFMMLMILFFVVYKLYQQINELKETKTDDIERVLGTFLQEIKEENRILQEATTINKSTISERIENEHIDEGSELPTIHTSDDFKPTIQGQVYQLYDQGVPINEIAKQLNRGKTEIELMIKFKKGSQ